MPSVFFVLVRIDDLAERVEEEPLLRDSDLVACETGDGDNRVAFLERPRVHDVFDGQWGRESRVVVRLFSQSSPQVVLFGVGIREFLKVVLYFVVFKSLELNIWILIE